jgi:hypothetical protein
MEVRFHAETTDPLFAIALRDELGTTSFATSTQLHHGPTGRFDAGDVAGIRLDFENWLAPGRYSLTASVSRDGLGADAFDLREDVSSIIVHAALSGGGAVDLPHRFSIDRGRG